MYVCILLSDLSDLIFIINTHSKCHVCFTLTEERHGYYYTYIHVLHIFCHHLQVLYQRCKRYPRVTLMIATIQTKSKGNPTWTLLISLLLLLLNCSCKSKTRQIVSINIYIEWDTKGLQFWDKINIRSGSHHWNLKCFYVNHSSQCIIVQRPENYHHKIWNNPNI